MTGSMRFTGLVPVKSEQLRVRNSIGIISCGIWICRKNWMY